MPLNLDMISECFRIGRYSITSHGFQELDNDHITIIKLETAIGHDSPEIIEDYPDDPRGASCLVLGWFEPDLPIHVCVGISSDMPEIITAYRPSPLKFHAPEFRRRRR
ncbi:MAG: DUF4258 domain-containing protein [Anaerolineales bacterium]|nr:DUF4258 domain-containing protein [Anaerolineales bacterium]MDP2777294.1 DUF4258 domain-containing protein [Anaerolineales bacterium]